MGFARAADCPVVLIGDIDRGGVIAQIRRNEGRARARRRRDDRRLHRQQVPRRRQPVRRAAWRRSPSAPAGAPSAWSPFFPAAARLPAEDAFGLAERRAPRRSAGDDRRPDARRGSPISTTSIRSSSSRSVRLVFVRAGRAAAGRRSRHPAGQQGDDRRPRRFSRDRAGTSTSSAHVRRGGRCSALCGGYQMLGTRVADPEGIEGRPAQSQGLGLLDVETVLTGDKTLQRGRGRMPRSTARRSTGYEMHVGRTDGPDCARPLLRFADGRRRRRDLGRRARRGRLCAWPVRRRPPARRLARLARRASRSSPTRRRSSGRSTRSPRILPRISISTPCSALAR